MKVFTLFFAFTVTAAAQNAAPTPPSPPSPTKISLADCSLVDHSPACRSFNEMVAAQDKDLTAFLDGTYIAYVCFEKDADVFRIVSVSSAVPILYKKEKTSLVETQRSMAFFQHFQDGVSKDFEYLGGTWKRGLGNSEYFETDTGDRSISLSDSEITYTDVFQNLNKTKTHYSLSIRRSTLRFAQNYRFPSEDNKTTTNLDETGRCLRY